MLAVRVDVRQEASERARFVMMLSRLSSGLMTSFFYCKYRVWRVLFACCKAGAMFFLQSCRQVRRYVASTRWQRTRAVRIALLGRDRTRRIKHGDMSTACCVRRNFLKRSVETSFVLPLENVAKIFKKILCKRMINALESAEFKRVSDSGTLHSCVMSNRIRGLMSVSTIVTEFISFATSCLVRAVLHMCKTRFRFRHVDSQVRIDSVVGNGGTEQAGLQLVAARCFPRLESINGRISRVEAVLPRRLAGAALVVGACYAIFLMRVAPLPLCPFGRLAVRPTD